MKIVIHSKPDFKESGVRLLVYSIKFKKFPRWWYHYDCEYFPARKLFSIKRNSLLDHVIKRLYESEHDIPNCEDCELVEEPINYRQMEREDRD